MSRATITIEASAIYSVHAPTLQVLVNGAVYSSAVVTATTGVGADLLGFTIDFSSDVPSSLSFRFTDGFSESGRSISIEALRVNGGLIDHADLTAQILNQSQSSALDVSSNDYLFGRAEPASLGVPTISGTTGDDRLAGTNHHDVISGDAGNDRILAYNGDDSIAGGDGSDTIYGGDDNDLILGQGQNDQLFGNAGADIIYGGTGDDFILGGTENDVINGGDGNDVLLGDTGDDIVFGETGNDTLIGGTGDDYMMGDAGADTLLGDAGADTLYGGADDDIIIGGADNDTISGDDGADQIHGDAGDDIISGGSGDDHVFGGDGNDTINGDADNDNLSGDAGNDQIDGGTGDDIIYGGAGVDTLTGGDGNDMLYGQGLGAYEISAILKANSNLVYSMDTGSFYQYVSGADSWTNARTAAQGSVINGVSGHLVTISTAAENAFVQNLVGAGNDSWLSGRQTSGTNWSWDNGPEAGAVFSNGSTATNNFYENWESGTPSGSGAYALLDGSAGGWSDDNGTATHGYVIEWGATAMNEDNAADTISGDMGADILYGMGGNDVINGGDGNDLAFGGNGADTINGDAGDDALYGGNGNDVIDGGADNDHIYGGGGQDTLNGGDGDDTIYGDNSAQVIVLEAGHVTAAQTSTTEWHSVAFSGAITNAVIMMTGDDVAGDPFTIRVRNITDTGFEFKLDEFSNQDGLTPSETLSWVAVSSGVHTLDNGMQVEAGFTTATNENSTAVTLSGTLSNPVVFSQLSSDSNAGALETRNNNVSSTGFDVTMQGGDGESNTHSTETIGWMAFEDGGSVGSGILAGTTGDIVTDSVTTVTYGSAFAATPAFIADMQTLDGSDASAAVASFVNATQAGVYIDEETTADTETTHTTENVGYVALANGTYTSTTSTSGDDTIHGGAGADHIYADGVVDTNIYVGNGSRLSNDILDGSPVAYWPLHDTSGTNIVNEGIDGSAIDGTSVGGPTLDAGALYIGGGTSIDFDGVNDGISIPDSADINTGTYAQRTVELVFNADDVTTRQVLYEEGAAVNGLTIYLDSGRVYITGEDDGNWVDADIHASVSTGTTYHVAFVFDQATNSLTGYLDGTNIGSVSVGNQVFPSHSGDIGIGYAPDGVQFHDGEDNSGGYNYNGRISDVAIYNSALTATELQAHSDIVHSAALPALPINENLYGGDGLDIMYGGDGGRDVFHFEAATAFNNVDQINGFDPGEQDAIDISDILTGYTAGTSDIHDFVQVTDDGTNTTIAVDANGAAGGSTYTPIVQINDMAGWDADSLLLNNSIIPD